MQGQTGLKDLLPCCSQILSLVDKTGRGSNTSPCAKNVAWVECLRFPDNVATVSALTGGFNGAAASRCGKPFEQLLDGYIASLASMRPRHHAAENEVLLLIAKHSHVASMRPRHHAAENHEWQTDALASAAKLQ